MGTNLIHVDYVNVFGDAVSVSEEEPKSKRKRKTEDRSTFGGWIVEGISEQDAKAWAKDEGLRKKLSSVPPLEDAIKNAPLKRLYRRDLHEAALELAGLCKKSGFHRVCVRKVERTVYDENGNVKY